MNTKDCTQGFCSLSCPQWCLIFPPPPPPSSSLLDDYHKSQSGSNFSPLVIAIIGILASAFLLVTYYAIVSKYCGNSRVDNNNNHPSNDEDMEEDDHNLDPSHHEPWLINTNGLDEALINTITLVKFKKGDALFGTSLCSICLGEFLEDHTLRLLPKCSHVFHVACIDTWLKSHSNCPLCRANILSTFSHPHPSSPPPLVVDIINQPDDDDDHQNQNQNQNQLGSEEQTNRNSSSPKCPFRAFSDLGNDGGDEGSVGGHIMRIPRSISMDHHRQSRVQRFDDLQGEEATGESSKASNARFLFCKHARGRNAVIPV